MKCLLYVAVRLVVLSLPSVHAGEPARCEPQAGEGPFRIRHAESAGVNRAATADAFEPGNPPLTRTMVEQFGWFLEWLMQAPLTEVESAEIAGQLHDIWRRDARADITGVGELLALRRRLTTLPANRREQARQRLLDEAMHGARGDPTSRFGALLVAIYDRSHRPIADGPPPLTRQAVDAALEFRCFVAGLAVGAKIHLSTEARADIAKKFAETWNELPAKSREALAAMPERWAAFRAEWPGLSEQKRRRMIATWKQDAELVAFGRKLAPPVNASGPGTMDEQRALIERQGQILREHDTSMFIRDMAMRDHDMQMAFWAIHNGGQVSYTYRW